MSDGGFGADSEKICPRKKIISPQELKSLLPEFFNSCPDAAFPLEVTGSSMSPFLCGGRDTALLSPYDGHAEKGDILLFSDSAGKLFLHRLIKNENGSLYFAGDAHSYSEGPLGPENVLAECRSVIRKGKHVEKGEALWNFYAHIYSRFPLFRWGAEAVSRLKKWRCLFNVC